MREKYARIRKIQDSKEKKVGLISRKVRRKTNKKDVQKKTLIDSPCEINSNIVFEKYISP